MGTSTPVQEVAPCTGEGILFETLGRVRRIITEKRRCSPLPENDLDSRPRLTPPVHIERLVYTTRNLWDISIWILFCRGGHAPQRHDQVVKFAVAMLLQ